MEVEIEPHGNGLTDRNLFGHGKSLDFSYRDDANGIWRHIAYDDPSLAGSHHQLHYAAGKGVEPRIGHARDDPVGQHGPREEARRLLGEGDNFRQAAPVYLTLLWCLREMRRYREALDVAEEGLALVPDAILAQWAATVEEELAEAEQERC